MPELLPPEPFPEQASREQILRTRFAPSPTGYLHVGNALSAYYCRQWAKAHDAPLLLRIEDIDSHRCRAEFSTAIIEDLQWLGIAWHGDIRYQSQHLDTYRQALKKLRHMQVIYPCFCTRREIQQEIIHAALAPHDEDGIPPYPGTCRQLAEEGEKNKRQRNIDANTPFAWRLDVERALEITGPLNWREKNWNNKNTQTITVNTAMPDPVIGRKDIGISYHLAVVVDDAAQRISHVIRGEDLRPSTGLHRLLQALLNLPSPVYIHHPLLCDTSGERLAKRNHAPTLRKLRTNGISADTLHRALLPDNMQRPAPWIGLSDLAKIQE